MEKIVIDGGVPLMGEVSISGAKNAALPILCSAILAQETLIVDNVPNLGDVRTLLDMLKQLGLSFSIEASTEKEGQMVTFHPQVSLQTKADYDLVRKMRASVLVLGPLLGRFGQAIVSLPGGCAIGNRPVDLHLMGLEAMGADIQIDSGYVVARAPKGGLVGTDIRFPIVSVGATENLMMAAVYARGQTRLHNCAVEPEVVNLGEVLKAMGVQIEGLGTATMTIQGTETLKAASVSVIADRIETATYAVAAAITGGDLTLRQCCPAHLTLPLQLLRMMGISVEEGVDWLRVKASGENLRALDIETGVYPDFPTDMQAQFVSLLCLTEGPSSVTEHIFENRFMHVPELQRMGADIHVDGRVAHIASIKEFKGASVMASDLRASASLVLAGLAAEGRTEIQRVYHLNRGYESLVEKLSGCGARISRVQT